jgi:hypothetical protein
MRSEQDLVSFVYRNGSVPLDNWMTMTIEPPGMLTFEDAATKQEAKLFPAEYRMLLDYALSSDFIDAVRRPMNPDCISAPDATQGIAVTWRDVGMQKVTLGSCGFPDQSDHVYARLVVLMLAIQARHLHCDMPSPGLCP